MRIITSSLIVAMVVAFGLLTSLSAGAQQLQPVTLTATALTVGTTATQCAPADASRLTLRIFNVSTTAKISYRVDGTTPVAGAAGTSTIGPGAGDYWPTNGVPRNAITCISDTASTPVTVTVGK